MVKLQNKGRIGSWSTVPGHTLNFGVVSPFSPKDMPLGEILTGHAAQETLFTDEETLDKVDNTKVRQ